MNESTNKRDASVTLRRWYLAHVIAFCLNRHHGGQAKLNLRAWQCYVMRSNALLLHLHRN